MFGIGMQELLLILVIALIVLGPKKLPEVAKALGKAMNEFSKATREIKESLEIDQGLNTVKKSFDAMNETPPVSDAAASGHSEEVKPPASPASEPPASKPSESPGSADRTAK